jgi:hypothetical protein
VRWFGGGTPEERGPYGQQEESDDEGYSIFGHDRLQSKVSTS